MKVHESHFNLWGIIEAKILFFSEINCYCSEKYFDSLLFEVYSIEQSLTVVHFATIYRTMGPLVL